MILYISVTKNINVIKFIKIINKKTNLQFDKSKEIILNRKFVFINSC